MRETSLTADSRYARTVGKRFAMLSLAIVGGGGVLATLAAFAFGSAAGAIGVFLGGAVGVLADLSTGVLIGTERKVGTGRKAKVRAVLIVVGYLAKIAIVVALVVLIQSLSTVVDRQFFLVALAVAIVVSLIVLTIVVFSTPTPDYTNIAPLPWGKDPKNESTDGGDGVVGAETGNDAIWHSSN